MKKPPFLILLFIILLSACDERPAPGGNITINLESPGIIIPETLVSKCMCANCQFDDCGVDCICGCNYKSSDEGIGVYDIFSYYVEGNSIAILGLSHVTYNEEKNIVIPSAINGFIVTKIDGLAFSGAPITAITLPDSVTNVGTRAFAWCETLETVIFNSPLPPEFGDDVFIRNNLNSPVVFVPVGSISAYKESEQLRNFKIAQVDEDGAVVPCGEAGINDIPPETQTSEPQSLQTAEPPRSETTSPKTPTDNTPNFQGVSIENSGMPMPFYDMQGGGDLQLARFVLPLYSDVWGRHINSIPLDLVKLLLGNDEFYAWVNSDEMSRYWETAVLSLMDYPNLYSLIKTFNLPIDEVEVYFKEHQLMLIDNEQSENFYFTDEEIALICSLNEAAIMEYFVSDYAIYHEGAIYSPIWFYCYALEDYAEAGITPEMIEKKLELYAEFSFTEEGEAAFEEKLSEFLGVEVSLGQ